MFGITSKIGLYLSGGLNVLLVIALVFLITSKNAAINTLEEQLTRKQEQLDGCNADRLTLKANQGTLEASLARQNQSISDMQVAAATKAAQNAAERNRASEAASTAAAKAAAIAGRKAGSDVCKSADDLILESVQ